MKQTENESAYSQSRTGERFWFTIAGYLAVVVMVLSYIFLSQMFTQGSGFESGYALMLLLLVFFSVLPYPAFVLDTSYIRGLHIGWTPSWRRYVTVGVLVPTSVFVASVLLLDVVIAIGTALILFLIVTVLLSVVHLYNRRKYVGKPRIIGR